MNQTASRNANRKTLHKYILLQVPGATMVGFLLVALYAMEMLSGGMAVLLMLGWCAKDALMFRFVRKAYEPGPPHGTEALVGREAIVVEACAPRGRVRIGPEHWSARPAREGDTLGPGERVRVVAFDGYTLEVERAENP